MSTLSRKPSAEESSVEDDDEIHNVKFRIKAVEHCLKGGKSAPSADINDVVPTYSKMKQKSLEKTLQQLQDKEIILLKMKLDIGTKGMEQTIMMVIISSTLHLRLSCMVFGL